MPQTEAIAQARREIDRLESLVDLLGKQIDQTAEVMKNQGLARLDSSVDPELVAQHDRLTASVDRARDRITDLRRQVLGVPSE